MTRTERTFFPDAGGPYAATVGDPVLLSATHSVDPDGGTLAFGWGFGDGTTASEPSSSHLYRSAGSYTVTLLAANGRGRIGSAITHVVVMNRSDGNHAPVIVLNGPYVGATNHEFLMVAAGSSDPHGDALSFAWTFGDGSSGSDSIAWHTFRRPGIYPVRVLVTDGKGGATRRTTLAVISPPSTPASNTPLPTPRVNGPESAYAGQPVTFDVRSSSAHGGDPLTFVWLFDDDENTFGIAPTHTFTKPGRHVVHLIVSDGGGRFATASLSIDIVQTPGNQTPVAVIGGPYAGPAGIPIGFNARASKDPDGDELTFVWDFGDGTKGSGPTPQHTYKQAGTFLTSVLVSDDNGGSVLASGAVIVTTPPAPANQPLVATAGGPYAGVVGAAMKFDGGASADPDKDPLVYVWAFGDGTIGAGRTAIHTYSEPGTYQVLLLVMDGKSGASTAEVPVTIR